MDNNNKSYEFTFLYLINKCLLLFKYIDDKYQKELLFDIKTFISKVQEIFSKVDFKTNNDKKNKILEVLIDYFEKVIDNKIYTLINYKNKDSIISEVEKNAFILCENYDKKKQINKKVLSNNNLTELNSTTNNNDDLIILEKKINVKIKSIFNEIESNIKNSLKNYFEHTQFVEYDLDKKFNSKIENNNIIIENKVKEILNDVLKNNINDIKIYDNLNKLIKTQINDVYSYITDIDSKLLDLERNIESKCDFKMNIEFDSKIDDKIDRVNNNIKKNIGHEIENKIRLLGNIFNEHIEKIFNNLNKKITDNEQDLIKIFDEKINNSNFNKNNFNIIFDKEMNEIKLLYCNELVSSTRINIKGLIGPKGPQGNKGDKGESPIIRKIQFNEQNKMKIIVQEGNNIYEVISDDVLPPGPQGLQGPKGEPGKAILDLKWNQDNVMRIDDENNNSLIFMKSLCVGDKSHCLKDNSLAIGGALCYQSNSIGVGTNSKTLDSESIALYGTCIGKRSFAYRADNVDENTIEFGKKDRSTYNINSYNVLAREINFDCDVFRIKTNKYENNRMKELEDRVIFLEKKMVDVLKKI